MSTARMIDNGNNWYTGCFKPLNDTLRRGM